MTYTITMDEAFSVFRSVDSVFHYIADFSTIEQWDHTVASSCKVSDGAVGLGSRFRLMLKFGLRQVPMDYEIVEYDFPNRVVLKGVGNGFTAVDTVSLNERDGKTHVDWHADVTFDGVMAKIAPYMKSRIQAGGTKTVKGLAAALADDFPVPTISQCHRWMDRLVIPGMCLFTCFGYKQARHRWLPDSSDMRGKYVVITGATSGIGLSAAYDLAHRGTTLTLVARNAEKAEAVKHAIQKKTGNQLIRIEIADMSLMADVQALARRLLDQGQAIDVLINNAGNLFNPRSETTEGIEQSFALLLLAPYLLTEAVYPLLKAAQGRVVNVLSGGMYSQAIDADDLQNTQGEYSGSVAYAKAKRGLMICTEEWAEQWRTDGIVVNAMHPGWADTPALANTLPEFYKLTKRVLRTPQQGGDTIAWLAASTQAGKVSGLFFLDREPHITHLSKKTLETHEQRQRFLKNLKATADSFTTSV